MGAAGDVPATSMRYGLLARSRPMVVAGAVAGQHDGVVGQREDLVAQAGEHGRHAPARQVGAADRPGEEDVTGEAQLVGLPARPGARQPEQHRPAGMARGVVDGDLQAGEREGGAVGQLRHVLRLGVAQPAAEERCQVGREALGRVGQHLPVIGVHVGGDAARTADRRDREGVVEVAVGEQHGGRMQAVLGEQRVELVEHPDAGVDHHALLPRRGGDHVAVGAEGVRGKAGHEHGRCPFRRAAVVLPSSLSGALSEFAASVPPAPRGTVTTSDKRCSGRGGPRTPHSQSLAVHSGGRVARHT